MNYYKRYWDESTGDDLTDSWGTSWYYFETDDTNNITRQLQVFSNGKVLKYDTEYAEDKFGGLSEIPLSHDEFEAYTIEQNEFEKIWSDSDYKQFPEIVITEDCLWGQPRLEGRRLAVGDIVSQIDIEDSLADAAEVYKLTFQQARQALLYCKTLQCKKDAPLKYCHNCTLRVEQDQDTPDEEQDNWKRAERLFQLYF